MSRSAFIRFLSRHINFEKIKVDQRLFIFLFFLFISATFWFLSVLSKSYTTQIDYPVKYTQLPESRILVGKEKLPQKLKLRVTAFGFTLLRHKITTQILPIEMAVNTLKLEPIPNDSTRYFLLTALAKEEIARQIGSDMKINKILPDSLIFQFASTVQKKLPVSTEFEVTFARQFMQKGAITTQPDSVTVIGPHTILDTLKSVRVMDNVFEKLKAPISATVPLQPDDDLKYSENIVTVNIPVEQYTEKKLSIPIEIENVPDTLIVKTFPNTVTVSFFVAFSDYNHVSPEDFRAVADYNSLKNRMGKKLRVRMTRFPAFVKEKKYHPKHVEYIIEK